MGDDLRVPAHGVPDGCGHALKREGGSGHQRAGHRAVARLLAPRRTGARRPQTHQTAEPTW